MPTLTTRTPNDVSSDDPIDGPLCLACAQGEPLMNVNIPWPGYTSEQSHRVDWAAFNAKGKHHILWNGTKNETVLCGSARCNTLYESVDRSTTPSGANNRQVGGRHYGLSSLQHWDIVHLFKLDYFQGQITKYVIRWRDKNGVEDLKKAQHFLEKYIELHEKKQ